jgi:CBS domain-containing protein
MLFHSIFEVAGSLLLGVAMGLLLRQIIRWVVEDEKILIFTISIIVLTIGLAETLKLDIILSSMSLGVTLINLAPRHSLRNFELLRNFAPPIYVLFFVVIGTRLNVSTAIHIWVLALAYIFGSTFGKTAGSYWGACYSKAVPTIRKYLGYCLYQQGTIAIALLIMASHRFEGEVRDMMLSVIIVGVFVLQLIGPFFVKVSIQRAGEAGMNITEEDLIKTYKVGDVMAKDVPIIAVGMSLREVIKIVSDTDDFYYPVVDRDKKLVGGITLGGIRDTFTTQELNDWLIALDIAEPIHGTVAQDVKLSEALEKTTRLDLEHLPVVESEQAGNFVGILDVRAAYRQLSAEVLAKQKETDNLYGYGVLET